MRLVALVACFVPAVAIAGVDTDNHYVMLHQSAGSPITAHLRVHCEENIPNGCGGASFDTESPAMTRAEFTQLRADAAATICDPSTIAGSPFDVTAGTSLGSWWTARTASQKAGLCAVVDEWW